MLDLSSLWLQLKSATVLQIPTSLAIAGKLQITDRVYILSSYTLCLFIVCGPYAQCRAVSLIPHPLSTKLHEGTRVREWGWDARLASFRLAVAPFCVGFRPQVQGREGSTESNRECEWLALLQPPLAKVHASRRCLERVWMGHKIEWYKRFTALAIN